MVVCVAAEGSRGNRSILESNESATNSANFGPTFLRHFPPTEWVLYSRMTYRRYYAKMLLKNKLVESDVVSALR